MQPLRVPAGGAEANAQAKPITAPETVNHTFQEFRAKYGDDVDRYYPRCDVAVEVPLA